MNDVDEDAYTIDGGDSSQEIAVSARLTERTSRENIESTQDGKFESKEQPHCFL